MSVIQHFPLLLNPFLNCLFNNPLYHKPPHRESIKLLSANPTRYTILVPETYFLLNELDQDTGANLADLCYSSEDFVESHIIKNYNPGGSKIYTTLNNKQILIKDGSIFTGKGFKQSLKLNIVKLDYFKSFADYFPKGSEFMLIYINEPLVGNVRHAPNDISLNPTTKTIPTFEQLLREFPLISKSLSEDFKILFDSFSGRSQSLTDLSDTFNEIVLQSYKIFQTLNYNLVQNIVTTYPNINLNESIHEYIEINIYDKIWNQIILHVEDKLTSLYSALGNLSLNQIGLPSFEPWELLRIENKVNQAIQEFGKLSNEGNNSTIKSDIVMNTFKILSDCNGIIIDADSLVGLLLIVVIHSKVKNIGSHLQYIKDFSYEESSNGFLNYALSTLEAVLFHLEDPHNIANLIDYSNDNKSFWNLIKEEDVESIDAKLKEFEDGNIPTDHCIYSKTILGESCLMLAIQTKNEHVFETFLKYVNIFPLDYFLIDRTVHNQSLMNQALQAENKNVIEDLISIISKLTLDEQVYYYNIRDSYSRNIGHYLFHYGDLIPRIGHLIDWTAKDMNSQTPLFAIVRSYDNTNYKVLVETSFAVVEKWYSSQGKPFDLDDHIDSRGNSLLHILQSDLKILLNNKYLDVNQKNSKSYSSLIVYAKYNRIDNVKQLLEDSRLDIFTMDKNNYSIMDFISKNKDVENLIHVHYLQHYVPDCDLRIAVMNSKFDQVSKEWKFYTRGIRRERNETEIVEHWYSVYHSLEVFIKLLKLLKYDMGSFIPDFIVDYNPLPLFMKMKNNKHIYNINTLLNSLSFYPQSKVVDRFITGKFNDLDLLNELNISIEDKKINYDKVLTKQSINEIEFFVNFSLNDLRKYLKLMGKLNKLFVFLNYKQNDLKYMVYQAQSNSWAPFSNLLEKYNDSIINSEGDEKFQLSLSFLENCNIELIKNMNNVLTLIDKWWEIHNSIIETTNNLKKYEYVNKNGNSSGVKDDSFIFGNLIENKKNKYKKSLLLQNSLNEKILQLNVELKYQHEIVALEINNFLKFRNGTLQFNVGKYAKLKIRDLKYGLSRLELGKAALK